jgi:crooked neck
MVFADDERENNPTSFKFLQMAHAWKSKTAGGPLSGFTAPSISREEDSSEEDSDEDEDMEKEAGKAKDQDSDVASSEEEE